MELTQLRYFVAVAEELNFRKAAARLHMSQPPLSIQIAQLERQIGTRLLERSPGTQARLTAAGSVLLEDARRILAMAEQAAERSRRTGSGETGVLSVGLTSSMAYGPVPLLLRDFRRASKGIHLQLHELTTSQQEKALLEGSIDLGFCYQPLENRALKTLLLCDEALVLAVPNGHRFARAQQLRLEELEGEPVLSFPRSLSPGLYDLILAAFLRAGFAPVIVQEATQLQMLIAFVCAGLGVAIVPESMLQLARPGVKYRPFSSHVPRIQTVIVWSGEKKSLTVGKLVAFARHFDAPVVNRR